MRSGDRRTQRFQQLDLSGYDSAIRPLFERRRLDSEWAIHQVNVREIFRGQRNRARVNVVVFKMGESDFAANGVFNH